NPIYTIDDPAFVKSDAPVPATMSGYSSVGFPSIVVPMGFGFQGLPMTLTFFGKPYEERKMIGFAYAYEQASKMRKPSPLVPPLNGETINYATEMMIGARVASKGKEIAMESIISNLLRRFVKGSLSRRYMV